ncbi:hypothetical protein [Streptomyces spongiicola]|uniref:hypothetical protein n=1 Tax=Streptomyces spongiicola TaxID=1690221 RepID=UPI0013A5743F|nr:hypothetical protein [Streptomyces spongiicola]
MPQPAEVLGVMCECRSLIGYTARRNATVATPGTATRRVAEPTGQAHHEADPAPCAAPHRTERRTAPPPTGKPRLTRHY